MPSLTGDLATMDVADLLEWLRRRGKSGVLRLRRGSTEKRLGFHQGRLCASGSNDPRETLGQALVRDHLVSEKDLFSALLRQERERRLLGELMVEDGVLSTDQLLRALEANSEEIVYDVFLWNEGTFTFDENDRSERFVPLDMDLELVVEEGLHRRQQWNELRRELPSSEVRFAVLAGADAAEDPIESEMIELAAAGRTLAAISLETRRSRYETTLRLHALVERGVLAPDQPAGDLPEPDPVATIHALLASATELRRDNRFDAAMALYQEVLTLDRINQEAKKGLLAVAEEQRLFTLASELPRDKVPVLRYGSMMLSRETFDPHEGFVISRINGQWPVAAILKLCPMPETDALAIFHRLLQRGIIELT